MRRGRCVMCLKRCKNVKNLISHMKKHPRRDLLKKCFENNNRVLNRKKNRRYRKKWEEIHFSGNINLICGKGKVVIGDEKKFVEYEIQCEGKQVCVPIKTDDLELDSSKRCFKVKVTPDQGELGDVDFNDNIHVILGKDKITVGDGKQCLNFRTDSDFLLDEECNFKIEITPINNNCNSKSLDQSYECHCVENLNTSDTDSEPDSLVEIKFVCEYCCSGFDTEEEYSEHLKLHMILCRVCGELFPNQFLLAEHVKSHVLKVYLCHICNMEFCLREQFSRHTDSHYENYTLETVLDMERDYNVQPYTNNMSYSDSLNHILQYLGYYKHNNRYYNYQRQKVLCEICRQEFFIGDIQQHMQSVHYAYAY